MHQVLMVGVAIVAVLVSVVVIVVLALTIRIWSTWWARTAHVVVFLAASAALALLINWGLHARPWGGCAVHHTGQPCVTAPGD